NRGIAALGNSWFTYSNGTLSVWDQTGNRVGTTTLIGAGTSFDSHFSLSEANGKVFIVTTAGGTWDGYAVGFSVTGSVPADGAIVAAPPSDFVVDFSQ